MAEPSPARLVLLNFANRALPCTLALNPAEPEPRSLPEDNLSVRAIRELELQLKETT